MVQHNNQVVIAAIEGMGGVGKTELISNPGIPLRVI
jgi:MinD-like ATPase involved in chromosome partitioning or flagellar assembly